MSDFELRPFPRERELIVDSGFLAASRHIFYGLAEVDVTLAHQLLRDPAGAPLSFTAFIVASLGRALKEYPQVQAYRDWRGRLVIFNEVDVVTLIEPAPGAAAIPHVIRCAESRTVAEISAEIRSIQAAPERSPQKSGHLIQLGASMPRFVRLFYLRMLKKNPQRFKRIAGTTLVTAVGMFGRGRHASGGFWGIPFLPMHTLGLTVGGITQKPGVVNGEIAVREYLNLTLAFDHDVVDGAPAARFGNTLGEIIFEARVLKDDQG